MKTTTQFRITKYTAFNCSVMAFKPVSKILNHFVFTFLLSLFTGPHVLGYVGYVEGPSPATNHVGDGGKPRRTPALCRVTLHPGGSLVCQASKQPEEVELRCQWATTRDYKQVQLVVKNLTHQEQFHEHVTHNIKYDSLIRPMLNLTSFLRHKKLNKKSHVIASSKSTMI